MPRKPKKTTALPLFAPGFWPQALTEAWALIFFSCAFALLFNAFYPDGIELKYKEPKKIYLMDFLVQKAVQEKSATQAPVKNHNSQSSSNAGSLPPSDSIPRLSLVGAKLKFDKKKSVFLDARKNEEYQAGHIPGAYNLFSEDLDQDAPKVLPLIPDKDQDIVCYCHGGDCDMALRDARFLMDQGYTHVEVYLGGWPEWSKVGYPTAKGENP